MKIIICFTKLLILGLLILKSEGSNGSNKLSEKIVYYSRNTLMLKDSSNQSKILGENIKIKSSLLGNKNNFCYNYIDQPKEIENSNVISAGMMFYQGIKSPNDSNLWIFLERQNKGSHCNLWYYEGSSHKKKLLFSNNGDDALTYKPISWNTFKNTIYLEKFEIDGAESHLGIWEFDLNNMTFQKIPISDKYMSTPLISRNLNCFIYTATTDKNRNPIHGMADLIFGFDLNTKKEFLIEKDSGVYKRVVGWLDNEITQLDVLNLDQVDSTNSKELALLKSEISLPNFKLPYPSGVSSCVTRTILPNPPGIGCTAVAGCSFPLTSHSQFAIDFGTLNLNENVLAAAEGTVIEANFGTPNLGNGYGWGNQVRIQHSDGSIALYGHLNSIGVRVGEFVSQGCIIGKVGSTGLSTGVHLHFEVRDASFSTSYTTSFSECGCTPYPSFNCISGNTLQTCNSDFSLNCNSAIQLTCGVPYNGSTIYTGNSGNSNVYSNGCNSWNDPGPEVIHQISVGPNTTFTAQLSNLATGLDLDVFILSACNTSSCLGTISSNSSTYTSTNGGTYYILVDGYQSEYPSGSGYFGNYGSYTLTVTGNCNIACVDSYEPNDACQTAPFLFPTLYNSAYSGSIDSKISSASDQDWFPIGVDCEGDLTIDLTNLPADYDVELYQISSSCTGHWLGRGDNHVPPTASENISYHYPVFASTTLYVKVYGYNNAYDACNNYHLNISWTPSNGCVPCTIPSPPSSNPATNISQNTFQANWSSSSGATDYYLDVAYDNSFINFVSGYQDLNVGNVLNFSISGLNCNTPYYYRVRAADGVCISNNSGSISLTTSACSGIPNFNCNSGSVNQTGNIITVSTTINNTGTVGASNVDIQITLFSDPGLTTIYRHIGVQTLNYIGPLSTATTTGVQYDLCNAGIQSGTYYLGYYIDLNNTIGESNDGDNGWCSFSGSITINCCSQPNPPTTNPATNISQNSFQANWSSSSGANAYYIDVAYDNSFINFVSGYQDLNVGNVLNYSVQGLNCNTPYYYRVRAADGVCISNNSGSISLTTSACSGDPNFNCNSGSLNQSGNIITVSTTINNTGTVGASNVDIQLTLFSDLGLTTIYQPVGVQTLNYIGPLSTATSTGIQYDLCNAGVQSGTYYLGYYIDLNNTIGESNDADNGWCSFPGSVIVNCCSQPNPPTTNPATNISQNSFQANWSSSSGANTYYIDVAYDNSFINFVSGYQDLNVGNVLNYSVQGLNCNTPYYYRVRAADGVCISNNSGSISLTTSACSGDPNFNCNSGSLNQSGNIITVSTTINNTGTVGASNVDIQLTLFSDPGLTTIYQPIGVQTLNYIGPLSTATTTGVQYDLCNAGVQSGTYYLGYYIDLNNTIGESNDADNGWCSFPGSVIVNCCNQPNPPTINPATNISQNSFQANWTSSSGANTYYIDIAYDNSFINFVSGHQDLNVGNVLNYSISGLNCNTPYYYRVRAADGVCISINSSFYNVTTSACPCVAPVPANCTPLTTQYCCGIGIYNVTLNSLTNQSNDGFDGYQDYTCNDSTLLFPLSSYLLSVTTGPNYVESVRAWLDYNNDGNFNPATELIFADSSVLTNHFGNFIVPSNAVSLQPLRLRVATDYSANPIPAPCTNLLYGQAEDYTVFIDLFNSHSNLEAQNSFNIFPNPFEKTLAIEYQVMNKSTVTLEIYDMVGRLICTKENNSVQSEGHYSYKFEAQARGVYWVKLSINGNFLIKKAVY